MFSYNENVTEEMTAAFAHEVKNPVSLIKANIELLELDKELEVYKNNITVIKKELNKITEIITDFISFCKPTYEPEIDDINLYKIIEESIEDFSISTNKKNIKFHFNCACDLETLKLRAAGFKLSMLFSNIYKNAVESICKDGSIETKIDQNDNKIIIEILDDGEGLNKDIKEIVCKPFVTSKKEGSGLGLPICIGIINELGGNFEIFNRKDKKGCGVRITL